MDIYNKSQLEISLEFEREMKQEYNAILQSYGITPVNTANYSTFGIAANTPGMSLAEAQILNDFLEKF